MTDTKNEVVKENGNEANGNLGGKNISTAEKILTSYRERINNSADTVFNNVVDKLVDTEIDERVALILVAVEQIQTLEKEISKLEKPDTKFMNSQQEILMECLSEQKASELKAAQHKYSSLNKALELATAAKPNFSELRNLFQLK